MEALGEDGKEGEAAEGRGPSVKNEWDLGTLGMESSGMILMGLNGLF